MKSLAAPSPPQMCIRDRASHTSRCLIADAAFPPSSAAQNYQRLLCEGLCNNGVWVTALSAPPVTKATAGRSSAWLKSGRQGLTAFVYLPILGIPAIKHLLVWLASFLYTLFALKPDGFVLCNGLTLAVSEGARVAARLRGRPAIAFVTDVPEILGTGKTARLMTRQLKKYDGYLLLTQPMNGLVNPHNKPYLVMEGMTDASLPAFDPAQKYPEKVFLYAGMLYGLYGVDRLVRAFMRVSDPAARLHLYGAGDAVEEIMKASGLDKRIRFMGQVSNGVILREERKASVLVNPRPTGELYTAYSFPSKNLEYMASGTPVLTTRLPGMPEEYLPYVYLFEDETERGMTEAMEALLTLPEGALLQKGAQARAFVEREKSNTAQTARLLSFVKGLERHGS